MIFLKRYFLRKNQIINLLLKNIIVSVRINNTKLFLKIEYYFSNLFD